ncbi:alanine--glyoxylate aminotransferase family protein [Helicobacter sp. MIT 14-3879]|uniref:pyridoxal-phosphate-dependent aminotransferase family protein n=1 Tax=Helicobacter sp. MIT 14-3879 TaxID=2040649 RepID=UPI000E1F20D4|nr:alanine--glyoxylate aminotransferase family protein [Helicobacter sp. MIT 14-3879]RDU65578.1 aminotransferase [Helicobacter sp. MIT 14-3879]
MLLFTPGPTPSLEVIRNAMALPTLHHRTKEFEAYFEFCREKLKDLLNMQEVLMLACSGSGAMEASIKTFCKKPLCINSGKFGERFVNIAKSHNIDYIEVVNEWDTAPSVDEIKEILLNNKDIDSICIQICESAGGLRHNVEEIAKMTKSVNENIIIIADGITAIGVEKIDSSNIDVLIGGSQKAFMLPPGMAILGFSKKAIDIIEKNDVGFYFNLKTELKNQRKNTTAWTAPTTIIIGLAKYFEIADIKTIYKETRARALATQEALKSIGLIIYPKQPSLAMSTIYNEDSVSIRKILRQDYDVNIAGGQDKLKDNIFRINHMGIISIYESSWVVNAIELTLDKLNYRAFDGVANRVFLQKYYMELKDC